MSLFYKAKKRRAEKYDGRNLPLDGEPNSNADIRNDSGNIYKRRKYDDNGKVVKDYDFRAEPKKNADNPHAHDWEAKNRSANRGLNKKEIAEANKAAKKRRFFNHDKKEH